MKVMNIPTNILKPGMVIYEDIHSAAGDVILFRDTVLDQWQIEKIHNNNVEKVRIKLTENDGLYAAKEEIKSVYNQQNVISFKKKYETKVDEVTHIIKEIGRGVTLDVHSVNQISRHIIKEFGTVSDVINYLHLVRPMDDYT